ncbi:MAG: Uma2 family endonuclease [Planctomycetes bacterium]|nr:Uma2 family endonuclease [Planctomycetota bacterium]
MDRAKTMVGPSPAAAVYGWLDPARPGPTPAEVFEGWPLDEEGPVELIGGWVLPMPPGDFETGELWSELAAALRPLVKARRWRMALDARHRLPRPANTVVFPDVAIHATSRVACIAGTKTLGRVPDLVVEVLSEETHERDLGPRGAKFLAYQQSRVREYYCCWPDGRKSFGFVLRRGAYVPIRPDAEGFFRSDLLGVYLRLVEPATRPL